MRTLAIVAVALLLTACAAMPTAFYAETEHVSHPFAGPPFGPSNEEDALDQVNVGVEWRKGGAYLQTSLGYVTADGGFYGPPLTFTARAGYRIQIKRRAP